MIKGVNKQIVEINYTQNDYIEKAILIINPEKSKLSKELINQKADAYMKTLLPAGETKPGVEKAHPLRGVRRRLPLIAAALAVLTLATALLLVFAFLL